MRKVLSVSSSRADVGILAPVWNALGEYQDIDLHVLLTGMHMADCGSTILSLHDNATVTRVGADLGGTSGAQATSAMANIAEEVGAYISEHSPDVVLVIGDRLDMLPAATASLPSNTPLVHLHGGEVTEGAIDDRIRHAITKLADWHCVSTEGALGRLLAMGESSQRITVTGAPGLDTLRTAPVISRLEFFAEVGFPEEGPFRLITVHPETNALDILAPLDAVLEALRRKPMLTLFTAPNSDPGGAESKERIAAYCRQHDWAKYIDTLGPRLYPNALRHANVMVGNSSSGIIEAGLFGLPVVNVGDRQKGRERGPNVIDVPNCAESVLVAFARIEAADNRFPSQTPYGDGYAGPKVARVIADVMQRGRSIRTGQTRMEDNNA